jgi:hypothetical protein
MIEVTAVGYLSVAVFTAALLIVGMRIYKRKWPSLLLVGAACLMSLAWPVALGLTLAAACSIVLFAFIEGRE